MGFNPAIRAERSEAFVLILLYRMLTICVDDQFNLNRLFFSARSNRGPIYFAVMLWNRCCKASDLTLFELFNKQRAGIIVFL